jgi:hypothetical protein
MLLYQAKQSIPINFEKKEKLSGCIFEIAEGDVWSDCDVNLVTYFTRPTFLIKYNHT